MNRAIRAVLIFTLLLAASDLLAYHFGRPISVNCQCSGDPCESITYCDRESLWSWILQPFHLTSWFAILVFAFAWAVDNFQRLLPVNSQPLPAILSSAVPAGAIAGFLVLNDYVRRAEASSPYSPRSEFALMALSDWHGAALAFLLAFMLLFAVEMAVANSSKLCRKPRNLSMS